MNINNPTQQMNDDAEKQDIEEHHAIQFNLGAQKYKYGKLIEEMKNDFLRKKYGFPETLTEACHVLSKWRNNYSEKYINNKNESNDGIVFATVTAG